MPTDTAIKITGQRNASRLIAASNADVINRLRADYLCDGTADDVQINAALTAMGGVVDGSVMLTEGTFSCTSNLSIPEGVVLEGQGHATVLSFSGTAITSAILIAGANAELRNFKATLAAGAGDAGTRPNVVNTGGFNNLVIENLWIIGDTSVGDDGSDTRQNGIYSPASDDMIIKDCRIEDCDRHGIYMSAGDRNRLANIHSEGHTQCGFKVIQSADIILDGCIAENCTTIGIFIYQADNCLLTSCVVEGNTADGVMISSNADNMIVGCIIRNNGACGLYLNATARAVVTGNTIEGNTVQNIYCLSSNSCVIVGNSCYNSGSHGIHIFRSSYTVVQGNSCVGNTGDGINITGDATTNADYNLISGNVCQGNTDDGIEIAGSGDANNNQVVGNMLQGNSGTALVDGGTLTIIKNNEGQVGFGDDKAVTLVVAASNSIQPANADYYCDGTADDVQINAAFAAGGAGAKVVLLEGTYTLADPIIFTNNNQVLEGMGEGTFIDGDGLATTEHAIQIDAKTGCTIRNLSVQTPDGGALTVHCIFINDGANDTTIECVTIVDSESDGIHIEGTSITNVHIHSVHIKDADDHGIYVGMDTNHSFTLSCINECLIEGTGNEGIQLDDPTGTGTNNSNMIMDNIIYQAGEDGIDILTMNNSKVYGNVALDCTTNGILLTNCDECVIANNVAWSCGYNGIRTAGTSVNDTIVGNVCTDNGADGEYAGINTASVSYMTITGNHCYNNRKYGIAFGVTGGGFNTVSGNHCYYNYEDGIAGGGADTMISGNFVHNNSQGAAETDHGIRLTNNCARVSVVGNWVGDDGTNQEDGIHLEDGATEVKISGNYIYNQMGSGIVLVANNDKCQVTDNYVQECDDYGIEIAAASCDDTLVVGNVLQGNVTGQISNAGTGTVLAHNETGSSAEAHEPREATIVVCASDSLSQSGDYVCDGTADEVQIQAALDAIATPDGRVLLLEGTYNCAANITLESNECLEGQGWNTILNFDDSGGGTVTNVGALYLNGDNIRVANLKAQLATGCGAANTRPNLIYSMNHTRLMLENLWLVGDTSVADDVSDLRQCGVMFRGITDSIVQNCHITDCDRHAISTLQGSRNRFLGNHLEDCTQRGFHLTQETDSIVDGCNAYSNGGIGIYFRESNTCSITSCVMEGNTADGAMISAGVNDIVTGNVMRGNSAAGLYLNNTDYATVSGNNISGNTVYGIYVLASDYCVIGNNICYDNLVGIAISRSDYGSYTGNGCHDNSTDGINLFGDATANSDYNTLTGNCCTDNGDDGIAIEGAGDANKNIVVANQLHGNSGTNLVDNGTDTQLGHNITA